MSVGLFVFVASVIGVGLLGSYTVIVVFVWVVILSIICCDTGHVWRVFHRVFHKASIMVGVFHRVFHRFGGFPHDDGHIVIWVTGVIHRVFHK